MEGGWEKGKQTLEAAAAPLLNHKVLLREQARPSFLNASYAASTYYSCAAVVVNFENFWGLTRLQKYQKKKVAYFGKNVEILTVLHPHLLLLSVLNYQIRIKVRHNRFVFK